MYMYYSFGKKINVFNFLVMCCCIMLIFLIIYHMQPLNTNNLRNLDVEKLKFRIFVNVQ